MKLSKNFTLHEFTRSRTATKHGIDNTPSFDKMQNGRMLVKKLIQPLRDIINAPVVITSGYRCPELNEKVGGEDDSQHTEFKAGDLFVPGVSLHIVYQVIISSLEFDQCIYEYGQWIHVSFNYGENRNKALVARKVNGKTEYKDFEGSADL